MNHTVWLIFLLLRDVAATCEEGWHEYRGRCYYDSPIADIQVNDFDGALRNCETKGANLAAVTSLDISQFIIRNIALPHEDRCDNVGCDPNYEFWIGLTKNISGVGLMAKVTERRLGWTWQDAQKYEWQNWRKDEPGSGEGFARMRGDGTWGGSVKIDKHRYICEQKGKSIYIGVAVGTLLVLALAVTTVVLRRRFRNKSVEKETANKENTYYNTTPPREDSNAQDTGIKQGHDYYNVASSTTNTRSEHTTINTEYEDVGDLSPANNVLNRQYENSGGVLGGIGQRQEDPYEDLGDVERHTDGIYLDIQPNGEYETLEPSNVTYTSLNISHNV